MTISNVIELLISICLEIWLIVILVRRRVRDHLPLFFFYIVMSAPVSIARLVAGLHYELYFYVYWSTNAVLLLLGLAALDELMRRVYRGFYELTIFRVLYYGAIAFALALSIRNSFSNPPAQATPLIGLVLNVGIAVNLLQAGIACLFYAFLRPFAVAVRRNLYGAVLGFLVSSLGPLLGYFARSVFGTNWHGLARYASPVGYNVALLIWIISFIVPDVEETDWTPPLSPGHMLREIREYMKALDLRKKQ